jgi:hypothetical protein
VLVSAANVLVSKSVSALWPVLRSCAWVPLLAMSPTRMPQMNSVEAKRNGKGFFIRVMMPNDGTERSGGQRRSDNSENAQEPSA